MYGKIPPVTLAVAVPSLPLQVVGAVPEADSVGDPKEVRVSDALDMQPLASVTLTE